MTCRGVKKHIQLDAWDLDFASNDTKHCIALESKIKIIKSIFDSTSSISTFYHIFLFSKM